MLKHNNDRALIAELGGPAKLAEMLRYPKHGGVQRVSNWTRRGIPAAIKLEYQQIFLIAMHKAAQREKDARAARIEQNKGAL